MPDRRAEPFPEIRFQGTLRPSQRTVEAIAEEQLAAGKRRLHIIAPPGSGKTIIGLYLWACHVRRPALVLSPNSAIQAQWAARTSLFVRQDGSPLSDLVSTSPQQPRLLTSLTYQSITLPARADEQLDVRALDLWIQTILQDDQAESSTAAEIWVDDLRRHNPDYYDQRLAYYRKRVRDDDAANGRAMAMLHDSCVASLQRLRDAGVGLLVLDECHHLMGHWGRVLSEVSEYFGDPVIVGLTATPPDREGRQPEDIDRYDRFFGEVDFEVPVPAVVKDGYLAPYQDLAYFVRPTSQELQFIAQADQQFRGLVEWLCQPAEPPRESLIQWIGHVLRDKRIRTDREPTSRASNWRRFYARHPEFAAAAIWFLRSRGQQIPADVPAVPAPAGDEETSLVILIDRYTRHYLRRSPHPQDHELAKAATDRLRMLGVQITETGHRPCASPLSRVIAYTRNKTQALVPILSGEVDLLGGDVRAVVIADYEKTSAVTAEISHLLDEEAGGAIAAFRSLLDDPKTNSLDPILVTGSTVLVDADLIVRFLGEAKMWLRQKSMNVGLDQQQRGTFCVVTGSGSDWCPRVYVEMITDLFQRGVTRCLVGTRGLLGEGWDANKINVLVDLSTVATSMTVNQLRGRSIRLDPNVPDKLANNWDVVCIAPEFTRGLDDYLRFKRKHQTVFGICDDGAIEQGVGHVHAAFTDLRPELLESSVSAINHDMLRRAGRRGEVYRQWEIGNPYSTDPIRAVEVRGGGKGGGCPPFPACRVPWSDASLALAIGHAILAAFDQIRREDQTAKQHGRKRKTRRGKRTKEALPPRSSLLAKESPIRVAERDGGYVRIFLENVSKEESQRFATAIGEAMGPLDHPRYVIPRFVDDVAESFVGRLLPELVRRLFEKREQRMVMLHAVPAELAAKRELVDVYQRYWNHLVSPGEAVYAKNDKGQQSIDQAVKAGHLPETIIHNKEVFL